jgi:glycosyltransferase involved in cell wall biosynthesis
MRVIVASTVLPFVEGGGTFIVDWLEEMLKQRGHQVEALKLPFFSHPPAMLEQMLALRLLDVSHHADRLICIRPPSYLLRHPAKVLWFIHHHRGVYDYWGTPYQDVPDTPDGTRYGNAIIRADEVAFSETRAIFTNSRVVAARLKKFNNVDSEVLYPPLLHPERFACREYGDFILYASRAAHHKRQLLAIEAMRHTRTPVKLVLAGRADSEAYALELRKAIERLGVGGRVRLDTSWISEEEKVRLFAECLAAMYIPLDEDSYGYPSLEAHHSQKAVLTTTDAGGTAELIVDGENGLIVPPEPEALAAAMDRLYEDRALARRMGEAGPAAMDRLQISWDRVVDRLLA